MYGENHLVALFVGRFQELFETVCPGSRKQGVPKRLNRLEVRKSQFPVRPVPRDGCEKLVGLSAVCICGPLRRTAITFAACSVFVGEILLLYAVCKVLHDGLPHLYLAGTWIGRLRSILHKSQIQGDSFPENVQDSIAVGPHELRLRNILRLLLVVHVGHLTNVRNHVIGPVDKSIIVFEHR